MNYIKDFFKPQIFKYEIKIPENLVYEQLKEALPTIPSFNRSSDLIGHVDQNSFAIKLASPLNIKGSNFSSNLNGTFTKTDSNFTKIEISIERSPGTYTLFFFFIALFIIFFCVFCVMPNSTEFLFLSLLMLIGGTFFCIRISNIACKIIKNSFDYLIYNTFRKP